MKHTLERTVLIAAPRSTVFAYFTDSARFAAWWGAGSTIDPRPGGEVRIVYPNGAVASGSVLELEPVERVVFTFGYEDPAKPIAPGGSEVTLTLEEHPRGTRLRLRHLFSDETVRDQHVPGWRFQLALFANVVSGEAHGDLEETCDRFFGLQAEPDAASRASKLERVTTSDVRFRDAYACLAGRDELLTHLAALQAHSPVPAPRRDGPVRHCQGTAVVNWVAGDPAGGMEIRGTSVLELAPDGRLASICGLWSPPGGTQA